MRVEGCLRFPLLEQQESVGFPLHRVKVVLDTAVLCSHDWRQPGEGFNLAMPKSRACRYQDGEAYGHESDFTVRDADQNPVGKWYENPEFFLW